MERIEAGVGTGLRLTAELEAGMGTSLEVSNLVRDVGGFNVMAAALELLFSQDELGMYLIELCIELTFDVVKVSVLLDLSNVSPVVKSCHS